MENIFITVITKIKKVKNKLKSEISKKKIH